jgi:hypothetical protein
VSTCGVLWLFDLSHQLSSGSNVCIDKSYPYFNQPSTLTVSLVLKLALLGVLTLASAVFSVLAVGAWWYSWGTGGAVEVEGWLK